MAGEITSQDVRPPIAGRARSPAETRDCDSAVEPFDQCGRALSPPIEWSPAIQLLARANIGPTTVQCDRALSPPIKWSPAIQLLARANIGPTTVVLRNIPVRCNLSDLLATVIASGFQGKFEYLYLPVKPTSKQQNRGYVLVRFKRCHEAAEFCSMVGGCRVSGRASDKIIDATRSDTNIPLDELINVDDLVIFDLAQSPLGPMLSGSITL